MKRAVFQIDIGVGGRAGMTQSRRLGIRVALPRRICRRRPASGHLTERHRPVELAESPRANRLNKRPDRYIQGH